MLVRNATNIQDTRTKILKAIGRLSDTAISDDSRNLAIKELTDLLKGEPMSIETFNKYDIEAELVQEENKPEILVITIPVEYLPISMAENQQPAKVSFTVTKVMDMDFRNR